MTQGGRTALYQVGQTSIAKNRFHKKTWGGGKGSPDIKENVREPKKGVKKRKGGHSHTGDQSSKKKEEGKNKMFGDREAR